MHKCLTAAVWVQHHISTACARPLSNASRVAVVVRGKVLDPHNETNEGLSAFGDDLNLCVRAVSTGAKLRGAKILRSIRYFCDFVITSNLGLSIIFLEIRNELAERLGATLLQVAEITNVWRNECSVCESLNMKEVQGQDCNGDGRDHVDALNA
ncbi:hypothetical protein BC830DRAFT_1120133 [Chytriomyces sp. MP71]|nr:hypothetical protein BC830DRAFT_1120133 [Chytriomyces sp. MP71]